MVLSQYSCFITTAVPQLVPLSGGAVMPIWSILNQPFPDPSQEEKAPEHLYSHTMTGPCACVHCDQIALTLPPALTGAESGADVPPLHRIAELETDKTGS